MKKLAVMLTLVLVLLTLVCSAAAQDFWYSETENGIMITGYTGTSAEVIIPEKIEGKPVTSIFTTAFSMAKAQITKIVIPSTVTDIHRRALAVGSVQRYEISGDNPVYATIDGVLFRKAEKELVAYPAGREVKSYTVPEGICVIGEGAFCCQNLQQVNMPSSLLEVQTSAFSGGITSVVLPAKVKTIIGNAFTGMKIESIEVDENNPYFYDIDGVLFAREGKMLLHYPTGKEETSYVIPEGTEAIGQEAITVSMLREVTIPGSVKKISTAAFANSALGKVILGEGVEALESGAFFNCYKLKEVTIPASVIEISPNAFVKCSVPMFYVKRGSAAVDFCVENNYQYVFDDYENTDWLAA